VLKVNELLFRIAFIPLEKWVGHSLKPLEILSKIWAPPRKLFAIPDFPSWFWACSGIKTYSYSQCVLFLLLRKMQEQKHLMQQERGWSNHHWGNNHDNVQ